jgi:hypothetical protein
MMTKFTQAVREKIGYYVYVLKDPKNGNIFYIGKGNGDRIFKHILGDLTTPNVSDKLNLIREIGADKVQHYILRHGLSEEQSFEIESACIDLLGLDNLTNAVKGHDSWERGLKTVDEVAQHYDAKVITITEPSIIININRLYKRFMTPQQLYEATRSAWKVASFRRNQTKYAVASFRGLVREVYEIESWNSNIDRIDRWEFIGKIADENIREKYINQSLDNYIKKGSQNPIKYTF